MNSNWNRIEELTDKITFLCFRGKKSFQISYLVSYLEKRVSVGEWEGEKTGSQNERMSCPNIF